jgi:hypothetical protein
MGFSPSILIPGLVIVLLVIVGGVYLYGAQVSRRRVRDLIQQSIELMRPIGKDETYRWLGRTGCEIVLGEVKAPFRGGRIVVWVEPRELLPVWLINRARGKEDVVGVALDLLQPPTLSLELVDPASPAGRRALTRTRELGWTETEWTFANDPRTLATADLAASRRALTRLSNPGGVQQLELTRLGISANSPHVSVTIGRPDALTAAGTDFVRWLNRVAETVADVPPPPRQAPRQRPSKPPRGR